MEKSVVVGIDIGGTKLRIGLVDETFALLDFFLTQEHRSLTPWELVDFIVESVKVFLHRNSPKRVLGIGVGYPGPVDFVRGTTLAYSNLLDEHWQRVPLAQMLTERMSLPVWVDNDANLVGLAEMYLGASRNFTHWVYVTISTGLG
ncbi:MAG: ROK family protein, partial [Candidatus Caldatribacteriaceae bacterium]